MRKVSVLFFLFAFITSFKLVNDSLFTIPENWPKPNYDFSKNPLSLEKVTLGRTLFYDPILSRDSTISCASCHSSYTAFAHVDHALSHGIEDKIGTRNASALMNLAWNTSFMWDGAINHIDMQALFPITQPNEMDEKIERVVLKLQHSKVYPSLFFSAFGDSLVTGEHVLKSISQFMITLVSANSRYDSMIRKQIIFTEQENMGYRLFQQNCSTCHQEPLFTNFQFENNGLPIDSGLKDLGRISVSGNKNDYLKFKVPSLRNIEFSYPYMHDGRFKLLSDVLMHYTTGIVSSETLSNKLKNALVLSSNEKVDLIAFLLTLTDRKFLFDKKHSYLNAASVK